jgi:hypothetical protein
MTAQPDSPSHQLNQIPPEDYRRLLRAATIYSELAELTGALGAEELAADRLRLLAIMRLVDAIFLNLHKITARKSIPCIEWNNVTGMKACYPKLTTDPNMDSLLALLTNILPGVMPQVTEALRQCTPLPDEPRPEDCLATVSISQGTQAIPFRTLFKHAPSRSISTDHPFLQTAAAKLCNLMDVAQEAARIKLEVWYQLMPEAARKDLSGRLRTTDDTNHVASSFEVVFHEMFRRRGFDIKHNVLLSSHRPDFLISKEGMQFYLEVLSVWQIIDVPAGRTAFSLVLKCVERAARNHLVAIDFLEFPSDVDKDALEASLRNVTDTLPTSGTAEHAEHINDFGVNAIFRIRPRNGIASKTSIYEWTLVGASSDESELAVKRAVRKQIKHMSESNLPLVLAVCSRDNAVWDDIGLLQNLFGDISIDSHRSGKRTVTLHHNGRALSPDKNTRISAIAFCRRRWDRNQLHHDLLVIHNPWAKRPLAHEAFAGCRQVTLSATEPNITMSWDASANFAF